jgi:hypothetical protein
MNGEPLHLSQTAHRTAAWWLAAIVGCLALLLAAPAVSHAEEANPNNYNCLGHTAPGKPEAGSEEQQVTYVFYCTGPITGYQLQSQIPVTGVQGQPLVTNMQGNALTDTFSCSGEVPGWADNCVDPLLTVTYAYLEKGVVTQAISGPFDLGRPIGCHPDSLSGFDRLNPKPETHKKAKGHGKGKGKKKGAKKK